MEFLPTRLPDVIVIRPEVFEDSRGFFMETWTRKDFEQVGIDADFVQDNYSSSVAGTVRGLHYQIGGHRENWCGSSRARCST